MAVSSALPTVTVTGTSASAGSPPTSATVTSRLADPASSRTLDGDTVAAIGAAGPCSRTVTESIAVSL